MAFGKTKIVTKKKIRKVKRCIEKKLRGRLDEAFLEKSDKKWSEKTWDEKFPFFANWGDDDEENVPEGEKRFRVRIVEIDDGAKVYIDYPNESLNKTKTAQSIINILFDYLKT